MKLYTSVLQNVVRPGFVFPNWTSISNFDVSNQANHIPIQAAHFGAPFMIALTTLNLEQNAVNEVKRRCFSYLVELLVKMKKTPSLKY